MPLASLEHMRYHTVVSLGRRREPLWRQTIREKSESSRDVWGRALMRVRLLVSARPPAVSALKAYVSSSAPIPLPQKNAPIILFPRGDLGAVNSHQKKAIDLDPLPLTLPRQIRVSSATCTVSGDRWSLTINRASSAFCSSAYRSCCLVHSRSGALSCSLGRWPVSFSPSSAGVPIL